MAWKKGDPNHPRRGKGAGKGSGWGGEAKGASVSRFTSDPQPLQGKANTAAVVREREARLALLKDNLFNMAMGAEREETRLSATIAALNREEGLPIARQLTATTDENRLLRIEIVDATSDADSGQAAIQASDPD